MKRANMAMATLTITHRARSTYLIRGARNARLSEVDVYRRVNSTNELMPALREQTQTPAARIPNRVSKKTTTMETFV